MTTDGDGNGHLFHDRRKEGRRHAPYYPPPPHQYQPMDTPKEKIDLTPDPEGKVHLSTIGVMQGWLSGHKSVQRYKP